MPVFGRLRIRSRESFASYSRRIGSESSVEPSSTAMNSKSLNVWLRTLSTDARRYRVAL